MSSSDLLHLHAVAIEAGLSIYTIALRARMAGIPKRGHRWAFTREEADSLIYVARKAQPAHRASPDDASPECAWRCTFPQDYKFAGVEMCKHCYLLETECASDPALFARRVAEIERMAKEGRE
jgi:hypothetical protein